MEYRILVKGPIKQDEIHVIFDEKSELEVSEIEENEINKIWNKIKKKSKKNNVMLFDGILLSLVSWSQNKVLKIIIQKTRYKYYTVGLEINNSILKEKLIPFFPLSISALTISKDEKIVFGERSRITFMDQKKIHLIPAGHPELRKISISQGSNSIDLFKEILREAKEEIGIKDNNVEEIIILGIIENLSPQKPEIIFQIKLNITVSEIIGIFKKSKDRWEHRKLHHINMDRNSIISAIENNANISTIAKVGLHLFSITHDNTIES